jgi:CheY-like chemotaxis protein
MMVNSISSAVLIRGTRVPTVSCRILHVTDDDADHHLFVQTLKADSAIVVERLHSGVETLRVLRARASHELPSLIIIPSLLPLLTGIEFIHEIKSDDRLQVIPVIVFAATLPEGEAARLYEAGAACVVYKGGDLDAYERAIRSFQKFWIDIAILPSAGEESPVRGRPD